MEIINLNITSNYDQNQQVIKAYADFEKLIHALRKKYIPAHLVIMINQHIAELNMLSGSAKTIAKELRKRQLVLLTLIEKEIKLVTRHHYRKLWMLIGMLAFGVPMGIAFGAGFDNMAFLGIGMLIGMYFGFAIGNEMDHNAYENGNQLDFSH